MCGLGYMGGYWLPIPPIGWPNCGWWIVAPIRIMGFACCCCWCCGTPDDPLMAFCACCCCMVILLKGRGAFALAVAAGRVISIWVMAKARPPKIVPVRWVAVSAASFS